MVKNSFMPSTLVPSVTGREDPDKLPGDAMQLRTDRSGTSTHPIPGDVVGSPEGSLVNGSSWTSWSSPKHAGNGATRTIPPSETVRRVSPLMERIGVSRIADVTHLDRNGVPNFIAARPREAGEGISYYNGKGASRSQARASAMMEAIERYSGEVCLQRPVFRSFAGLSLEASAVDPADVLVPRVREYRPESELEWVLGFELIGRVPTYVPLNSVVWPYKSSRGETYFCATTNGLAAGNTRDEAVCQALCEVNERDAISLYQASRSLKLRSRALYAQLGIPHEPAPNPDSYRLIDPATLPLRARRVHGRLVAGGLSVYLRDATSETRIATFECIVTERQGHRGHVAHGGCGSHPNARVAALRALTEAAQSRVSFIQGGREDLPRFLNDHVADPDRDFGSGPVGDFSDVPLTENLTVGDDIASILEGFKRVGLLQVIAVDLTRPELGIPVVRIIVPGAESWPLFLSHGFAGAIGKRALARLY